MNFQILLNKLNKHKILCLLSVVFVAWVTAHILVRYPMFEELDIQKVQVAHVYNHDLVAEHRTARLDFQNIWSRTARDPFHLYRITKIARNTTQLRRTPRRRDRVKPPPVRKPPPAPVTRGASDEDPGLPFAFRGILKLEEGSDTRVLVLEDKATGEYHTVGVGQEVLGARVLSISSVSAVVETDKGERYELMDYIRTYYGSGMPAE